MADLFSLFAIGLFAAALPGPDILYISRSTLSSGLKAGWTAALGVLSASLIYLTLVGIGLGALGQNPFFRIAIGTFGAIYLLWIAKTIWHDSTGIGSDDKDNGGGLHTFFKGMAVHLSNPKAIIFFSVVLAPFLTRGSIFLQISVLTLAHMTTFFGIAYLISRFDHFFTPSRALVINRISSILFTLFALQLIWSSWVAIEEIS